MFLLFWGFKGETLPQLLVNPEAERTLREGKQFLTEALQKDLLEVDILYNVETAVRRGNDIVLCSDGQTLPMLRSQSAAYQYRCLADYFDTDVPSPIGLFLVTARPKQDPTDEGERLMTHALCARLAEAGAEYITDTPQPSDGKEQSASANGFSPYKGESEGVHPVRYAFGYASCPDHSLKRIVFDRLEAEQKLNVALTDHYSILPSTSVCGLLIWHAEAKYFPVGRIDRDQLRDYCRRRKISIEEGEKLLSKFVVWAQAGC